MPFLRDASRVPKTVEKQERGKVKKSEEDLFVNIFITSLCELQATKPNAFFHKVWVSP